MKDDFFGGVDRPDEELERNAVNGCGCKGIIAAMLAGIVLMLVMCGCRTTSQPACFVRFLHFKQVETSLMCIYGRV